MHCHELGDPKPAARVGQPEAHFVTNVSILESATQWGRKRNVPGINIHHFGQDQNVSIGFLWNWFWKS